MVTPPSTNRQVPLESIQFMSLPSEMSGLFSIMNPSFVSGHGLTIQFIGADSGEGVSTIARDFALTAAQYVDGLVLLLDFDWGQDSHLAHFQQILKQQGEPANLDPALDLEVDLSPLVGLSGPAETICPLAFHRIPEIRLILGRFDSHRHDLDGRVPCILNRPDIWSQLRSQFMLTVVDSPPFSRSFDGIVMSSAMDAVILVVRAESTRTPVVENLRDRLIAKGAPLAGLVLNQRRFYIPKSIYRFLGRL